MAAALREVREEVGLPDAELRPLGREGIWLDVDSHDIPANPRNAEPAHVHHDLRFAFVYEGAGGSLTTEAGAVDGYRWMDLDEAGRLPGFARVIGKLRGLR